MATYTYHCDSCDSPFEKILPMARYKDPQECPECGVSPARKTVSRAHFILKGDGWDGKNNRISGQMKQKNRRLSSRQATKVRDSPSMSLAPNVGGERTDTWGQASKLAGSKGKDTTGYEKRAVAEKKTT